MAPLTAIGLVAALIVSVRAEGEHSYAVGDKVPVYVDTIGSFYNPAEAYPYYSLPVCAPSEVVDISPSWGDLLSGSRRQTSVYDIKFGQSAKRQSACKKTLQPSEVKQFMAAIDKDYSYKVYVDDLPIYGFFGEKETFLVDFGDHQHNVTRYFLYSHMVFTMEFNEHNVITASITADVDGRVELKESQTEPLTVDLTYSTEWEETSGKFADRISLHSNHIWSDQSMNIHWLSIINSFILVLLLTVFLAIIVLRVLRNDFARYSDADDELLPLEGSVDESGWKQVHGDVFRFPTRPMLFSALIGNGTHLFAWLCILLLASLSGAFSINSHGGFYSTAILAFAVTAPIAGFVSAYLYAQIAGDQKWATNAVLTAGLFFAPLAAVFLTLNMVASAYGSLVAVPFFTVFGLILLWMLVVFPLTVVGAMRGRTLAKPFDAPCKTNRVQREIPPSPWYQTKLATGFMGGFLPFSAIYIEMHYIFAAVWGHQVYRLFGMLVLAFVMLVLVTSFITVSLTYFQLAHENYLWWWSSFINGGASGAFVFAYSVFYYFSRSSMSGGLQASFFFGYMLIVSLAFSLIMGTIGFMSSLPFVRYIYASIKSD